MSEELKAIYRTEKVRIAEDVDLTVDIVEKIVTNISPENVNKTPEVIKSLMKFQVTLCGNHFDTNFSGFCYSVNLSFQFKSGKIGPRKNLVFWQIKHIACTEHLAFIS